MADLEARVLQLERLVERLTRRARVVAWGRSTMAADDTGAVQTVQAGFDAMTRGDAIPIMYHHGFFSSPPIGADLHVIFLNGDRSNAVVVAGNHQTSRFKGAASGDAGLSAQGHLIHLNVGGITIEGNIGHTGNYTLTGNLTVTGSIIAGFGGADQVTVQKHIHDGGDPPTPGT